MIKLLTKLKYKITSSDVSIPQAEKVTPFLYIIAGLISAIGLINTLYTYFGKSFSKKITPTAIAKTQTSSSSAFDLNPILTRNIFNLKGIIPDAESDGSRACSLEPFRSSLPYKISGILFGGTSQTSLVVLEGSTNGIYKVGDLLPQGGTVHEIEKNRIYVVNKNCPEYIELAVELPKDPRLSRSPQNASGATYKEDGFERNGNSTTATKQWVNNILTNDFAKTLEEAKASPNIVGGQVKGFSITNITPNSVYAKLGLRDGDIVSAINGIELNDAARAIQTLNSMRNENTIEMQVIRGGQTISFKVNVQ